jgi:hypothetical protein
MSTPEETQPQRERTTMYVVIGIVVVALMVLGLVLFRSAKDSQQAQDKADRFIAGLEAAGAPSPPRDEVIRVLGSDGGATCEDPNNSLNRAIFYSMLTNGAAGPGIRPVVADRRFVAGQLLILKVYCPDELPDFQNFVDKIKSADVAG